MKDTAKRLAQAAMRKLAPAPNAGNGVRTEPVSRTFGLDRGQPIDRYYIEAFLAGYRSRIRGVALEVGEPEYANAYRHQLEGIEILHVSPEAKSATVIGDLSKPEHLPREIVDCFICTQTYQFIYDVVSAIRGSHQLLKPGGTLLATVPGISQVSRYDMERWGDFWRFTTKSMQMLMQESFEKEAIEIQAYGNVFAAKAFLDGLSVEDLPDKHALDRVDPDYPVIIGICAARK